MWLKWFVRSNSIQNGYRFAWNIHINLYKHRILKLTKRTYYIVLFFKLIFSTHTFIKKLIFKKCYIPHRISSAWVLIPPWAKMSWSFMASKMKSTMQHASSKCQTSFNVYTSRSKMRMVSNSEFRGVCRCSWDQIRKFSFYFEIPRS